MNYVLLVLGAFLAMGIVAQLLHATDPKRYDDTE